MYQDVLIKNQNKKNAIKGYTLLEVLISTLILGVIALCLSHTLTSSLLLTNKDQDIITANNLARLYLKDVGIDWKQQMNFDQGTLPEVNSLYTDNNSYIVTASQSNIASDAQSIVILKRVQVVYQNQEGTTLVNVSLDYNRPGSFMK